MTDALCNGYRKATTLHNIYIRSQSQLRTWQDPQRCTSFAAETVTKDGEKQKKQALLLFISIKRVVTMNQFSTNNSKNSTAFVVVNALVR